MNKRKLQIIRAELIADGVEQVLDQQGFFNLWVLATDRTFKDSEGNIIYKWERINGTFEAREELRDLIVDKINEII